MNPLLEALFALGGSGSIEEVYEKVIEDMQFDDALLETGLALNLWTSDLMGIIPRRRQ
jgi:hypothetical protein